MIFLLSNVAVILWILTFERWKKTKTNFVIFIFSSFWFIYLGTLAIGHWIFSYEYYNMVRIIPFVLDGNPPP